MGNAWGMSWHGMAFPHYDEEGSTSGSEIFPEYASAHKRITVGPKGRKGQRMVEGSFSSAFVKDKTRRRQEGGRRSRRIMDRLLASTASEVRRSWAEEEKKRELRVDW